MADGSGRRTSLRTGGGLLNLPLDIMADILSLLPIEDILRCRSVCKTWYGLTKGSYFFKLQFRRTFYHMPRLMFISKSENSVFLLDGKQCKAREIALPTVLGRNLIVMSSCNGLLCLASEESPNPVIISNPITRKYIVLPESVNASYSFIQLVGLGYDPWNMKYKVVRSYIDNSKFTRFEIITLGEASWRQLDVPCRVVCGRNSRPIYCEGALYWILDKKFHYDGDGCILAFDLREEKFGMIALPPNIRMPTGNPGLYNGSLHLLNVAGCLTVIADECQFLHIWQVMRNRDRGFSVRYRRSDMHCRWSVFSQPVLLDWCKDSLLLSVSKFGVYSERDLVEYFPERKQYAGHHIRGLPKWFRSCSFKPNLISPLECWLSW